MICFSTDCEIPNVTGYYTGAEESRGSPPPHPQVECGIGTPRLPTDRIYLIILDLPNWQAGLSRTVISGHVSICLLSYQVVQSHSANSGSGKSTKSGKSGKDCRHAREQLDELDARSHQQSTYLLQWVLVMLLHMEL